MQYNSKNEFLSALSVELQSAGITDIGEINADFEEHFSAGLSAGLTEAEVCDKLGDISEIVRQYTDEAAENKDAQTAPQTQTAATPQSGGASRNIGSVLQSGGYSQGSGTSGFTAGGAAQNGGPSYYQGGYSQPNPANQQSKVNVGGLVAIIIVDLFILSWLVPTVLTVSLSLVSVPISLVIAGVGSLFGGAISSFVDLPFFYSSFSPITTMCAGLVLLSLGGLASVGFYWLVILCIKFVKVVIDWHAQMIIGRKINWKSNQKKEQFDFSRNDCAFNNGGNVR